MSRAQWAGHCKATGKRIYRTETDAERALGQARSKRLRGRRGHAHRGVARGERVEYDYFQCESCGGYHLTSSEGRRIYEGIHNV